MILMFHIDTFISFLKEWQDLTGGIVGGVVGGLFTYLAVFLTLKNQAKHDYNPKKLVALSEMTDEINKLLLKAATVDKETYRMVIVELEEFKKKGYDQIGVPTDKYSTKFYLDLCQNFMDDLTAFRKKVSERSKYYEDQI
ncbi:hypothetical protein [Metabacillus sp. Hm71]|uniref:hypothetical protein n=1 Tax=Metabacillus sp. Hm71 TaxID=3450743 RepID=UPI003F4448E6